MIRRATLLFLPILVLSLRAFAAPPATVSVEQYRAQLQKAAEQLEQLEAHPPRDLTAALTPLTKDQIVKRADGQTQTASGDEFTRLLDAPPPSTAPPNTAPPGAGSPGPIPPNAPNTSPASPLITSASRETTRRVRESVLERSRALDAWARSTYTPADAQTIVKQLESSGQIRTGPTWLEQTWSNLRKWVSQTFQNLLKWVASLFPAATPEKMPQVDPGLIKAIFTITVIALLAAIAFLVWRAVGGKIGRKRKRQGAFAFSPEDAELLSLPPDELRERARKFAEEGNFREALRHLYIALLLNFDARGVWRYDARRTNWEHIAALRSDAARSTLVAPLSDITRRFDRVRYGNAECGPAEWSHFEQDVNALEASAPGARTAG